MRPQTCRACRRITAGVKGRKEDLLGGSCKAGARDWKTCSDSPQRMHTEARMRLPPMDTNTIPNLHFLQLAFLNPRDPMAAEAALEITSTAAQLPRHTQYLHTQHSLGFHGGTKTATRFFLYLLKYHHPTPRAHQADRPHHALPKVAADQLLASNRLTCAVNLRPFALEGIRKPARPDARRTKINLLPHMRPSPAVLCCSQNLAELQTKKNRFDHATHRSLRR